MHRFFNLTVLLGCICFYVAAEESPVRAIDNGSLVMRALLSAYPRDIDGLDYDFEARDWFITMKGQRLYWAQGRLLPAADRERAERWRPYVDYLYPPGIPDPQRFSPETIARLDPRSLAASRTNAPVYHGQFMNLLYDGATRVRIESHIRRIDYLGKRVSVHERLLEPLRRVEARLYRLAEKEAEVRAFIDTLQSIEGYNWREIADSPSRSNHSWGIAVDFLPRNWGQKNIYWNWVSYWNDKWMLIPLDRRWMPPEAVIQAFEDEGFIWGGKWLLWDNMHFEYRPELLLLQKWGHTGSW